MDSNNIDSQLKEEFKRDFLDQLQEVERLLLKLEDDPDNLDHIRNIFRPFHTIKGNAGMIGEFEIQDISQLSESILDQVRQGNRKMSEDMIEAVFQSVDMIRAIVEKGNAQKFIDQIDDLKNMLKEVMDSDSLKPHEEKTFRSTAGTNKIRLNKKISTRILEHLDTLDKQINQCKIRRDFEPYLFDIFESVLALSSLFEERISMPHVVSKLKYLESYLTIINTNEIQFSKNTWGLLNQITSDIIKIMYPVLVNSLDIGVCYFNPADTIEDLDKSLDWLYKKGKKAIMININKTNPPQLDEIQSLLRLKKETKVPIAYIQRFFGHKMHWRDMEQLMEDTIKIESSFWSALGSFVQDIS